MGAGGGREDGEEGLKGQLVRTKGKGDHGGPRLLGWRLRLGWGLRRGRGQERGDDAVDLPGSLWRGRQLEKRENLIFRGRSIHGTIWGKRGGATGVLCAGWLRVEETSKETQAVSIIHLANFFFLLLYFFKNLFIGV